MKLFLCCLTMSFFSMISAFANNIVWHGEVNSNGEPRVVKLTLGKRYILTVKGEINLGKWWQGGQPLAEDACFEYNKEISPARADNFKNSMNIPVCDGRFSLQHYYESKPFIAEQNRILLWVNDTDYTDNSGAFHAQLIEIIEPTDRKKG